METSYGFTVFSGVAGKLYYFLQEEFLMNSGPTVANYSCDPISSFYRIMYWESLSKLIAPGGILVSILRSLVLFQITS